jgi:hypothetical protein
MQLYYNIGAVVVDLFAAAGTVSAHVPEWSEICARQYRSNRESVSCFYCITSWRYIDKRIGIVLLKLVGGAVEKQLPRGTVTVAVW